MKEFLKIVGIFAVFVICIPMLAFFHDGEDISNAPTEESTAIASQEFTTEDILNSPDPANEEFKVLDFTSGQVMTMTMYDYVVGAVMGEMPATFHEEALKAQAVAAHTYAIRRKEQQLESADPELMGAYISNDSTKYQAFFSPNQAKAFYGDGYEEYEKKVSAAVKTVINEILVYENEPIVAAFHSTSSGMTESSKVIWGNAVEYLVPVESAEDKNSPVYTEEKIFTADELSARLTNSQYGITLSDEKSDWLEIQAVSNSGTVTEIKVGDKILSGMELRTLLSLKSACFQVEYADGNFTFVTKGSGHGVGLSQYGANAMAENGSDYSEILLYYYKGAELKNLQG